MTDENVNTPAMEHLYRHKKRPQWGLAIMASEVDGRRTYQFEDGELRSVASGFYHLLEDVTATVEDAGDTIASLNRLLGINDKQAAIAKAANQAQKGVSPVSLSDQVAAFKEEFPAGFAEPQYKAKYRGDAESRRVKRHRDPAVADAQRLLSSERLEADIREQKFSAIVEDVIGLLKSTDLVSPSQITPLSKLEPSLHQGLATGIRDLLHGSAGYPERLGVFVDKLTRMMNKSPSWQVVTAIGALVFPATEICVSPSAFREQAKWFAPDVKVPNVPQGSAYERIAAMARGVRDGLEGEGIAPHDMLDVHDFIKYTMGASAKKRAEAYRAERLVQEMRAVADAA